MRKRKEVFHSGTPQKAKKKNGGGGKGEEGELSARQVPMNLKSASVALTTLRRSASLDRCGHVTA